MDPPAQAVILTPIIDVTASPVVLGNRYPIRRGQAVIILPAALHRDPAVWGEDALVGIYPGEVIPRLEIILPPQSTPRTLLKDSWQPLLPQSKVIDL